MLQEIDRATYDRMCKRLDGVSTFSQLQEQAVIKELPEMFSSWQEYRDYLLENLIPPETRQAFRKRWRNQLGEDWCREHVQEIMVNDTEGTKNQNFASRRQMVAKINSGTYVKKYDCKEESAE